MLLPCCFLNSSSNLRTSSSIDLNFINLFISRLSLNLFLKYVSLCTYNSFNLVIILIFLIDISGFSLISLSKYFIIAFDISDSYL